jgi:outer membrane immunogenic protein
MEVSLTRSLFRAALLLGSTAAAFPAMAADDLPPEFRSSAFEIYIGAFGSANMLESTAHEADVVEAPRGYLDGSAAGYGVRGGVDYVMDGWVLGAVADWSFGTGGEIAREGSINSELDMPNLATIRARAGYTAGTALVYVTGGYAQAEMELSVDDEVTPLSGNDNDWTAGWVLGAGVDVALTEQVSMGLEYLYISLDDLSYRIGEELEQVRFDQDFEAMHSIRLGVNYAFQI